MLYATLYLRWAARIIRTIMRSFALVTHKRSAALRAAVNKLHGLCLSRTLRYINAYNLRDNLSTLLNVDVIADMQVEVLDKVLIVKRSTLHHCTGKSHGIHVSHRRYGACSTYLERHTLKTCRSLLSLELISNSPTRRLGCITQVLLLTERIYLKHDSVGSHRQVLALNVPIVYEVVYLLKLLHLAHTLRYLESPLRSLSQVLEMTVRRQSLTKQIIEIAVKMSIGNEAWVLTFQSAACRVARIGEQRLFSSFALSIQFVEHLPRHKNLAAYLKLIGITRILIEHKRYTTDSLHIGSNIVAYHSVAARNATNKATILVGKRYRQSVVLHLAAHFKIFAFESTLHRLIPVLHILLVVGISQREHRILVLYLSEALCQIAAHTLRRRIGVIQFGMLLLKRL